MRTNPQQYIIHQPDFLAQLHARYLECKRTSVKSEGEHHSRYKGEGYTFADYKEYMLGDDVRFIDWAKSVQSRPRLYVKQFETEIYVPTYLILDRSASMAHPQRDQKFVYATNIALSLAYIALIKNDPVTCAVLSGQTASDGVVQTAPVCRSVNHFHTLFHHIIGDSRPPKGNVRLPSVIPACLPKRTKRGLVVFISDFLFDLDEIYQSLMLLQQTGSDVVGIRVIGASEENLSSRRATRVIDAETRDWHDVQFDPKIYADQLQAHQNALQQWCKQRRLKHIVVRTDVDLRDFVLETLVVEGLIG